jgi:nucleotide-binding universal stress UspA family protein
MKILFGVDGSDGSLDALRRMSPFISPTSDTLVLYYAPPEMAFGESDEFVDQRKTNARQILADAVFAKAKECLAPAVQAHVHTVVGTQQPKTGLLLAADDCRADLIVLGARGSGPVASVKLGGVARHVSRSATLPVLITRPRNKPAGEPYRVLLATDGSEASEQAGAVLHHAHIPAGSQGYLMTVVEPYFSTAVPDWLMKQARDPETEAMAANWEKEHEANKARKRAELAAYAKTLPAAFAAGDPIVAEGHPAEEILKTINEKSIDLLVIGAQGKNAWQRFMIGSTSETLLTQAPCSVLLVRRRPKP